MPNTSRVRRIGTSPRKEGLFTGSEPTDDGFAPEPPRAATDAPSSGSIITDPTFAIEGMVVGAIIHHNEWASYATSRLSEKDFSSPVARTAFAVIKNTLKEPDARIDEIMLAGAYDMLSVASRHEIRDLVSMAASSTELLFRSHVSRVATLSNERNLQHAAKNAETLANNGALAIEDRAAAIVENIQSAVRIRETTFVSIESSVVNVLDTVISRAQNPNSVIGLSFGFDELNKVTLGMGAGDLVIVAGRPSMGKTALALAMTEANLAENRHVMMSSMEMRRDELIMRMLSAKANVPLQDIRRGSLTEQQWESVLAASEQIKKHRLNLTDRAAVTVDMIAADAQTCKQEKGLDLIVIDYLQLIQASGNRENRNEQISAISRRLKILGMELEVPVVVLSQLNRSLESRPNKRPILSDLRESGAIEQDADVILFTYRDEVYNPDSEDRGVAELIVGKQRNGPLATVRVPFQGECATFRNKAAVAPLAPALAERISNLEKGGKQKFSRQSNNKQPF